MAGTGKSTICRTIARNYFDKRRLGASFFFSRGGGDTGHAGKFFTTVAKQLANSVPTLQRHICNAIEEYSDIANLSLHDQWRQLVLIPLSKLTSDLCPSAYVVVIDGLDECDDDNNIRTILHLLSEVRSLKAVRLRVFLTSRPEIPIRYGFYQIPDAEHQDFVLHNISPSIVDHDIRIFLQHNLKLIAVERSLGSGWPGEQIVKRLVHNASGLFIWAATAYRFVREGTKAQVIRKRLDAILTKSGSITKPEKHLDEIYTTVLNHSIPSELSQEEKEEVCGTLRHVLGSVAVLFSPLPTSSLCRVLFVSEQALEETLEDLHSIIDIPRDQTRPLRLHHPSFRDFLLDRDRCTNPNFQADCKQAHWKLATGCIEIMSGFLKQDICRLGRPGALVTDVESGQVEKYLPSEIQYACIYWIQHLQRSGSQLNDNNQVHQFLQDHLLHWLEAVGWMQKVSEVIHAITLLESMTTVSRTQVKDDNLANIWFSRTVPSYPNLFMT